MPVPFEKTCEGCGEQYMQSDMLIDHRFLCDKCRGVSREQSQPNTLTVDEWLEEIKKLNS